MTRKATVTKTSGGIGVWKQQNPHLGRTFLRVRKVLVDTLGIEAKEVLPHSILDTDLCVDSLDFMELEINLAIEFDIEVPHSDLLPDGIYMSENVVSSPEGPRLKPEIFKKLQATQFFRSFDRFETTPLVSEIMRGFSVVDFCRFVYYKVGLKNLTAKATAKDK